MKTRQKLLLIDIHIADYDSKNCATQACDFYVIEDKEKWCALFCEEIKNARRCEACINEFGD